jgi:hypothetical protein
MELLEGASEWAGRTKNGKSQRFSVRFSFLESLFVYRGKFTLISPVGLVKPFLMLRRGNVWRPFLAWKGDGCVKDTRNPLRNRLRHPGVRRTCWEHRGCIWRNTQFGRG